MTILNKYDETVEILANMAKVKMQMNAHKKNIEDWAPTDLIAMLEGEVIELKSAVKEEDIVHIIEEAADVMNFLVALTHQQITLYRNRKNDDE